MTEPTDEQIAAANILEDRIRDNGYDAKSVLLPFLAARDAEKDAALASKESELRWLRGIIGDAHSKSALRREVAQGRVEAWVKEHDAEVLRPWVEAADRAEECLAGHAPKCVDCDVVAKKLLALLSRHQKSATGGQP